MQLIVIQLALPDVGNYTALSPAIFRVAKQSRLKIWKDYVPSASTAVNIGEKNLTGKVRANAESTVFVFCSVALRG